MHLLTTTIDFVDKFREECASASTTVTSISGVFNNYLTRPETFGTAPSSIKKTTYEPVTHLTTEVMTSEAVPTTSEATPSVTSLSTSSPSSTAELLQFTMTSIRLPIAPPSLRLSTLTSSESSTTFATTRSSRPKSSDTLSYHAPFNHEKKPTLSPNIIGCIAGGAVGLVLIVAATVYLVRRRRKAISAEECGTLPPYRPNSSYESAYPNPEKSELSGNSAVATTARAESMPELSGLETTRILPKNSGRFELSNQNAVRAPCPSTAKVELGGQSAVDIPLPLGRAEASGQSMVSMRSIQETAELGGRSAVRVPSLPTGFTEFEGPTSPLSTRTELDSAPSQRGYR